MGISVLSWLVPFLKINIFKEQVISAPKVMYFANVIADNNSSLEQEVVIQSAKFTWDNFILFIGITISILFIVRFVKSLFHVRELIIKYPFKKATKFVSGDDRCQRHSFLFLQIYILEHLY
jgi:hypothetical protein